MYRFEERADLQQAEPSQSDIPSGLSGWVDSCGRSPRPERMLEWPEGRIE